MINNMIYKLKEQRNSIVYYALGLFGYTWMLMGMFPSMQKANLEELTKNMPEEFMKFFGGEGFAAYSTIEGFLSLEFLSFFFILIISFYVGSSAGSSIAGPIEKKTIDFDLSQPISRIKYASSQIFVGLLNSMLLVIITTLALLALGELYDVRLKKDGLIAFTIIATAFVWSIYGISILLSSIFKSKLSVVITTVVITMVFFVFSSLTNIVDKLKDFDKLSLFYLYNPQKLLETGNVNIIHLSILLGIAVVGILSSLTIFNKKDL